MELVLCCLDNPGCRGRNALASEVYATEREASSSRWPFIVVASVDVGSAAVDTVGGRLAGCSSGLQAVTDPVPVIALARGRKLRLLRGENF